MLPLSDELEEALLESDELDEPLLEFDELLEPLPFSDELSLFDWLITVSIFRWFFYHRSSPKIRKDKRLKNSGLR